MRLLSIYQLGILLTIISLSFSQLYQNESTREDTCSQKAHISASKNPLVLEGYINNETITLSGQGIHIIVIHPYTHQIVSQNSWDSNIQNMIDFINDIDQDSIVLAGCNKDISSFLNTQGYQALYSIGFPNQTIQADQVFTMIGKKGMNQGDAQIQFTNDGVVTEAKCIEGCQGPCWKCQANNPYTCTACHNKDNDQRTSDLPLCMPRDGYYETELMSVFARWIAPGCKNQIAVSSLNMKNGNYVRMYFKGKTLTLPSIAATKVHTLGRERLRGVYIAVFDVGLEQLDEIRVFDTGYDQSSVQAMVNFINSITNGKKVMLGMTGESTQYLNSAAYNAFTKIGASSGLSLTENDAYAIVGVKGFSAGEGQEELNSGEAEGRVQAWGCLSCEDTINRAGLQCNCNVGYYNYKDEPNCRKKPDNCYMFVSADSRGKNDGMFFQISILHKRVEFLQKELGASGFGRGICILQTNLFGEQIYRSCFDVCVNWWENKRLENHLNSLPIGTLVIFTVFDDASFQLTDGVRNQLRTFGFPSDWDYRYPEMFRATFSAIARKGQAAGEAIFQQLKSGQGASHVETCLVSCLPRCGSCLTARDECETCVLGFDVPGAVMTNECQCAVGFEENLNDNKCEAITEPCFQKIRIISGGSTASQDAQFYINQRQIDLPYYDEELKIRYGVYTIELYPESFAQVQIKNFNLKNDEFANFNNYINSVPDGHHILIAFANHDLNINSTSNADFFNSLSDLGLNGFTEIDSGQAFAGIGIKGTTSNQDYQIKDVYQGDAILDKCLQKCESKCSDCDLSGCTSCASPLTRENNGQCVCLDGFYETNMKNCQECDLRCATCTQSGQCSTCKNNRDSANDCQCLQYHYQNNTSGHCDQCQRPCQECDTLTNCQSCYSPNTDLPSCSCKTRFYLDISDDLCKGCIPKCLQCNDNSTCTQCEQNRDTNNSCQCLDGFYENASEDCVPCVAPCQNCSAINTCTLCLDPERLGSNCDCPVGKFLDTVQNKCVECDYNCVGCTELGSCTQCKAGRDAQCDCIWNYYEIASTGECEVCQLPCQKCTSLTECTECYSDNTELPYCDCILGYYLDNTDNLCKQCDDECISCTEAGSCTQCKQGRLEGHAQCPCLQHHFEVTSTGECQACEFPCLSCESTAVCTTCDGVYRQTPTCQCISGYFEDPTDKVCKICDDICNQCENTPSQCTKCTLAVGRQVIPPCKCENGFYDSGEVECSQCMIECSTCSDGKTCDSCIDQNLLPPFCKGYTRPKYELSDNENNLDLGDCSVQCLTCTNNKNNCSKCKQVPNRNDNPPDCDCQLGYHSENNTLIECLKCPSQCLECENSYGCTVCDTQQNRQLNEITLQCECITGYKQNSQIECVKCYNYEGNCLITCPESTVQVEDLSLCQSVTYEKTQHFSIFLICGTILISVYILSVLINSKRSMTIKQRQTMIINKIEDQVGDFEKQASF